MLAFSAALVIPPFVDWSQYRAQFEAEASKILGRRVTVNGDATARLFPFPSVRFTDVTVAGPKGAAQPAVTMDAFSMDAELAPFLSGEIHVFDMRMERPKANVVMGADGSIDWAIRPSTPFDPSQIRLENIQVRDAEIRLVEEGRNRVHNFTALNMTVRAKTLEGPWSVDGSGLFDGHGAALTVSTGRVDEKGQMRMRVTVEPDAVPARFETDGTVRLENAAPRYDGSLTVLSLAQQDDKQKGPREGDIVRVSGKFSADHRRFAVDEYRFETGRGEQTYAATGTVLVDLGEAPHFTIQAKGDQIRLDDVGEVTPNTAPRPLAERIREFSQALAALPQFVIDGTLDLDLPAIVTGDTTLRFVKLSARPNGNVWTVDSFSMELPGRTIVEAEGRLTTGIATAFEGEMTVASRQLSGLAAWLSDKVDERIRAVASAGASAQVYLTANEQSFRGLELIAGDTKLIGIVSRLAPDGVDPSVAVRLTGDSVDANALQALAALAAGREAGKGVTAAHNIDVNLKATTLKAAGVEVHEFDTAMRLRGPKLEIDKLLIGDIEGTAVSATATLDTPFSAPAGKADISLLSDDLAPLMRMLESKGVSLPALHHLNARGDAYGGLYGDSELNAVVSFTTKTTGVRDVSASISGRSGGTDIAATVTQSTQQNAEAQVNAQLGLKNANASPVLALLGIDALPLDLGEELNADMTFNGAPASGLEVKANLSGGDSTLLLSALAKRDGGKTAAEGTLRVKSSDIENYLVAAGVSLPGLGTGLPVDLKTSFSGTVEDFVLSGVEGSLGGATLKGELRVARDNDPASPSKGLRVATGDVETSDADLMLLVEAVLGPEGTVGTTPEGGEALFSTVPDVPLGARIAVKATTVDAGPLGVVEDMTFGLAVVPDGAEIINASGTYRGGALKGTLALKNNGGAALVSASGSWEGVDLARVLSEIDAASPITGNSGFSGNFTATGRSARALVSGLAGSGTVSVKGLTVSGLNAAALGNILAAADPLTINLTDDKARTIALDEMDQASFVAGNLTSAFTIAGGVMRLPPLTIETPTARVRADVKRDFSTGEIGATGEIEYKPGPDDVLTGAQPRAGFEVTGTLAEPQVAYATEPMVQYLTQRALEREQARVETMQAILLEKQRMRREMRLMAALQEQRAFVAEADRMADVEAQRIAEEQARVAAEEEAKRKQEEEKARKAAQEAARKAAEEEARRKAAEDAKRKAEEESARKAAEEAARKAAKEEAARAKAEAERRAAEEKQAEAGRLAAEEKALEERVQQATGGSEPDQTEPVTQFPSPPGLKLVIPDPEPDSPTKLF